MADHRVLSATDDAEARGDARAALDLILHDLHLRKRPDFWRPEKVGRLMQIWVLGSWLPRWVTSRWILAQAAQCLDERNGTRMSGAFAIALRVGGFDASVCADDVDLRTNILDHNWVFRQAFLYDLGGLRHFLDEVASADLVAGADHIRDWADTPMGGYQLLEETPRRLTWFDLSEGREVDTANIGSATLLEPGDYAIGRLQPIRDGWMFDSAPLCVPWRVARQVAEDPSGWVTALTTACAEPGHECDVVTSGHDFQLLTDVPLLVQHMVMIEVDETVHGRKFDASTADLRALQVGLVRAAIDGRLPHGVAGISPWATVAAAILDPPVFTSLLTPPRAGDGDGLRRLARRLPEPARTVCRELATGMESAA